jgi:thymidine phosphorylase
LAARAAVLGHQDTSPGAHEKAYVRMKKHLESGRAYEVFLEIAEQQGAHLSALERSNSEWIESGTIDVPVYGEVKESRRVESINTRALGLLLIEMGAGRRKKEDAIDHKVGLVQMKKVGETIGKGEPLCFLRLRKNDTHADKLQLAAAAAFTLTEAHNQVNTKPLVADWIK